MQYIFTMKGLGKIHPPDKVVLRDIWLSFLPGAKIGVLGLNGAGKSTLLRIMAGEDKDFGGEAFPAEGISVGFLPQEPGLDPKKNVLGNVEDGVAAIRGLLTRFDEVNAKFGEDMSPEEMDKLLGEQSRLQDRIDAANAWDLDSRLELAMDALRLPPADADVSTLSGGERRRVALCRLLLRSPDLLLLDEPTNHLDAESVAWLERFLKDYPGTVVAVTHDRYFLDNVAGWILELDRGHGIPWEGNYSSWLDQKKQRLAVEEKQETRRQRTLDRELEWIRMSPRARQAKEGAPQRVRADARRGHAAEARIGRDLHPARTAARRHRRRSARRAQGVWRSAADGRRQLHAAARRHCRRDRPKRRRQNDVVPDDDGTGETGRRNAAAGRHRGDRLRRSVPRRARSQQVRLGRDRRRRRGTDARQADRAVARLCLLVQFQGARSAAEGGSLSGGERNRLHLAKLLAKAARTSCCSTSRRTISTSIRSARSRTRSSSSPAASSSSATIAGSSTASRRTCWPSRARAASCGSRATTRITRRTGSAASAPKRTSRTGSKQEAHTLMTNAERRMPKLVHTSAGGPVGDTFGIQHLAFGISGCVFRRRRCGVLPSGQRKRCSVFVDRTGDTGGVYYAYGGGLAKVVSDHVPGVRATAESTAASVDNLKLIRDGKAEIAFTLADTAADAAKGQGPFAGAPPVPARAGRLVFQLSPPRHTGSGHQGRSPICAAASSRWASRKRHGNHRKARGLRGRARSRAGRDAPGDRTDAGSGRAQGWQARRALLERRAADAGVSRPRALAERPDASGADGHGARCASHCPRRSLYVPRDPQPVPIAGWTRRCRSSASPTCSSSAATCPTISRTN